MHKVLFRGKTKDTKWWKEGYLAIESNHACFANELKYTYFIFKDETMDWGIGGLVQYEVIPETVGRYTGVTVGNEKLFEGDVVEWHEDYDDTWGCAQTAVGRSVVIWDEENFCWAFETDGYLQPFNDWNWDSSFIIGNIHDNPELLKGGKEEWQNEKD